jgi:hypothetical protein
VGEVLSLATGVWEATIEQLQQHGGGRNECVVYWLAPQNDLGQVDEIVHPDHLATPVHYAPTQDWLNRFFAGLVRTQKSVVAQVHTHRTRAFHSATDDQFPLIHTPGYLSLVVANFAHAPIRASDLFLVEVDPDGRWTEVDSRARIVGIDE